MGLVALRLLGDLLFPSYNLSDKRGLLLPHFKKKSDFFFFFFSCFLPGMKSGQGVVSTPTVPDPLGDEVTD